MMSQLRMGLGASLISAAVLLSVGCSSTQLKETTRPTEGSLPVVPQTYTEKMDRFSAGDSEYSGFYNNFQYKATLRNSYIREVQLERMADYYKWDAEKLASEKEKSNQEMQTETEVFVSFFTPDRRADNLADSKTIWRIYLEVGGRRYQGKAVRSNKLLPELIALYPYHTRWTTPYIFTFPVPTTAIETQSSTLTITGPLGDRVVTFSAL